MLTITGSFMMVQQLHIFIVKVFYYPTIEGMSNDNSRKKEKNGEKNNPYSKKSADFIYVDRHRSIDRHLNNKKVTFFLLFIE
jgi:hypothetical protein